VQILSVAKDLAVEQEDRDVMVRQGATRSGAIGLEIVQSAPAQMIGEGVTQR